MTVARRASTMTKARARDTLLKSTPRPAAVPIPATPPSDNFAASTFRFYNDASALNMAGRWDGAVYLSGYVQECALKHLLLAHAGLPELQPKDFRHSAERIHHPLLNLAAGLFVRSPQVLALALRQGDVLDYQHPERRYWPDLWTQLDAEMAVNAARVLVEELVVQDLLDHGGALP